MEDEKNICISSLFKYPRPHFWSQWNETVTFEQRSGLSSKWCINVVRPGGFKSVATYSLIATEKKNLSPSQNCICIYLWDNVWVVGGSY